MLHIPEAMSNILLRVPLLIIENIIHNGFMLSFQNKGTIFSKIKEKPAYEAFLLKKRLNR